MQGAVGQHKAQGVLARRHLRRHPRTRGGSKQHDGSLGTGKQRGLLIVDQAIAADDIEVPRHQGERLGIAAFAPAQLGDGDRVLRIAGEMEAADTLEGDDAPTLEQQARGRHGILRPQGIRFDHAAARVLKPDARAAGGTGVGLGMETPIRRILVLGAAIGAHAERGHAGVGPVVGDALDDRQPGSAVGAIDKGVAVATVRRIEQLGPAGGTGGRVGHDTGAHRALAAGGDAEIRRRLTPHRRAFERVDAGERWTLGAELVAEPVQCRGRSPGPHQHPFPVVADVPAQAAVAGDSPHGGPKTDTLHQTTDPDRLAPEAHSASPSSRWMARPARVKPNRAGR